jgi:hypothetical protein
MSGGAKARTRSSRSLSLTRLPSVAMEAFDKLFAELEKKEINKEGPPSPTGT